VTDPTDRVAAQPAPRVVSIDVFRGLTILTMIWVNDLARLSGIPAWMRHVPSNQDGMTFVDVVFPAFLFIVGMAIPLSLGRRLERGESGIRVARHVLQRTLALLVIGVFMVNLHGLDAAATGMSRDLWTLLLFVSVILGWNQYPRATRGQRTLSLLLRGLGVVGLVSLACIYRGREGQQITWMHTAWWGILGLIGWAYATSGLAYIAFRRHPAGLMGVLALLIALYIGDKTGALAFAGVVRDYVWLGGHIGGHSAITVAGVIVALLVLGPSTGQTAAQRVAGILVFAAGLAAAGYLLRPLYGISKVQATPTWCLYSSSLCCVVYAALYWIMDVKGRIRWSGFLAPAGANPLLAYILPDIVWAVLGLAGVRFLDEHLDAGGVGILRSAAFALAVVALTGWLSRRQIRLHL
jgi:heparan-alpha-glucosaminide N-acetyltransferase